MRAYATNSVGTSYGVQRSFTTVSLPIVTTKTVTNVTDISATCGGNVTGMGVDAVTARGVCWSTSSNPTIEDAHTSDGSGLGSYTSSIAGLMPGTTYYLRAYATNSEGTAYGEQKSFTTLALPTITTQSVTDVKYVSASCGGNVTATGGASVTARGVCWSTTSNPTIEDAHTTNGTGTGSYTSSITGLIPGTTYYVRAYATNSVGTAYGEQRSLTTLPYTPSTVTDVDGNVYNTVLIGNQVWMRENLRTTKYANGTTISLVLGITASSTTPYRYYPDNDSANVSDYGYLYNWAAVMNGSLSSSANPSGVQGICPTGWHVPSDAEWTQLENYVSSQSQYVCGGDEDYIAKALASEEGWNSSTDNCDVGNNPIANNATGFSARPAGYHNAYFLDFGNDAYFWSATQFSSGAYTHTLGYNYADVYRVGKIKATGYSVRCVRNEEGSGSEGGGDNEDGDDNQGDNDTPVDSQPCPGTPTVTDVDGNVYNTVQIGEQCWMRENLRTTKYANGTTIPLGTSTSSTTAYRYYPDENSANVSDYGYLYNWAAVMNGSLSSSANPSGVQGICPTGWHVPSDAEWTELTDYVSSQSQYVCGGDEDNIAKALASEEGWNSSTDNCDVGYNPIANNATGFSARPAGYYDGDYYNFGISAYFWSATQHYSLNANSRVLNYDAAHVGRASNGYKYYGYSVRCIRN